MRKHERSDGMTKETCLQKRPSNFTVRNGSGESKGASSKARVVSLTQSEQHCRNGRNWARLASERTARTTVQLRRKRVFRTSGSPKERRGGKTTHETARQTQGSAQASRTANTWPISNSEQRNWSTLFGSLSTLKSIPSQCAMWRP